MSSGSLIVDLLAFFLTERSVPEVALIRILRLYFRFLSKSFGGLFLLSATLEPVSDAE